VYTYVTWKLKATMAFNLFFAVFLLLVCLMMTISQVPLGVLTVVRFYNLVQMAFVLAEHAY
jgi:hypothetical protein